MPLEPNTQTPTESTPIVRMPLSLARMLWYAIANLGFGAFYAFNNAALPLWLNAYTHDARLKSMLAGSHSFEGVIIQPLIGSLSDRSRTRLGRRRPFLLVAIPVSALFLLLTPLAAHLPPAFRLGAIVASIVLFTMSFNIAMDPYQSLMADITPADQRGRVTGVWMFVGALGQVVVLLLSLPIVLKFFLVAALMLLTTLVTCALTPEPNLPTEPIDRPRKRDEIRSAISGLGTLKQARLFLLMFLCYGAGTDAVVPNLTSFIKQITHCSDNTAQHMILVLYLVTSLGALPFGLAADKIGTKRLLLISMGLLGVAALNGLWARTLPEIGVVLALAGLGTAAQNASAYPMLTKLVPDEEIGFYTGLQTAALSIVGPLALILTGTLVNHSGYRIIFAVCAVGIFGALAVLLGLKPELAPVEIAARDREQGRTPLFASSTGTV